MRKETAGSLCEEAFLARPRQWPGTAHQKITINRNAFKTFDFESRIIYRLEEELSWSEVAARIDNDAW